ncbi:MAG: hypothetical protein ACK4X2_09710, partial [Bacteroidota bacterium]
TISLAVIIFTMNACNKETATTQTDVMNTMLTNKNWYLDYSITAGQTSTTPVVYKSYVGQSTYFVTYLKDGSTKDSDGLTGTYSVEVIANQSQIHVQLKTANGNPLEVIYNIISVGESNLVLSKVLTAGTPTQLYFTSK